MSVDYEARRAAEAKLVAEAERAAKAAKAQADKAKTAGKKLRAMRDETLLMAVREAYPDIDDSDDPVAELNRASESLTDEVKSWMRSIDMTRTVNGEQDTKTIWEWFLLDARTATPMFGRTEV